MTTDFIWKELLATLLYAPAYTPAPRGRETRELLAWSYNLPMPAYLTAASRKVNVSFMIAEAGWIVSGSNRLDDIAPAMKAYANFSDDGVFLRGAYGPKVVDQLGYVVDCLEADPDSRQAYMNIWRERPGPAKDIACTTGMQFFLRDGQIHSSVTMRSQDIVQGFTYDVFTFSMVANAVRLLLQERYNREALGRQVGLGNLIVTSGSLHLYRDPFGRGDDQFAKAELWIKTEEYDGRISATVDHVMGAETYGDLISRLTLAPVA